MTSLRRMPRGTLIGWIAFGVTCLWVLVGAAIYHDPFLGDVYFVVDTTTGRPVSVGANPLGLYVDQYSNIRSHTVLLNAGFTEQAVRALAFAGLGTLLLTREPRNKAGLICVAAAVLIPVNDVTWMIAENHLVGTWWGEWGEWFALLLGTPGYFALSSILILLLPDGAVPGRSWRPVAWALTGSIIAMTVLSALAPRRNLLVTVHGSGPASNAVSSPFFYGASLWWVASVTALLSLLHRLKLAQGSERAQIAWILLGASIFCLGEVAIFVIWTGDPQLGLPGITERAARPLHIVTTLALPVACAVAILRHRLVELDPLLRRVLESLVLVTVLTCVYLAMNLRLDSESFPNGNVLNVELVVEPLRMTVTAVALALMSPVLYRWLRGGMHRLVYGPRGSPADMMAALARRLAAASDPDEVLAAVADAVQRALPTRPVRVVLTSGGHELRRVTRGRPPKGETFETVPLTFQGADMGRVEVSNDPQPLGSVDRKLLTDLVAGAAAAVAAARRSSELQVAREQLVGAREQERRRIARDLHDGVGPVLSGLGFTLDALKATRGTAEAEHVTAQARQQVREAVQLVRRVAKQLRPPGVDQLGLLGALREMVAWHDSPTLRVQLTAGDLGDLTAATEVAAYAIVAEAVTNVARHANANSCHITLTRGADTLTVTIGDNGIGLNGAAAGLGRGSMIERAEELGGTCRITNLQDGGTLVKATIPTREPHHTVAIDDSKDEAQP